MDDDRELNDSSIGSPEAPAPLETFRPGGSRAPRSVEHPLIKKMNTNPGRLQALWVRIRKEHKGDPLRQASEYWQSGEQLACTGRKKRKNGSQTLRDMEKRMRSCYRELRNLNIRIQNWDELSGKHVTSLVRSWEIRGLSASTMQNKLTPLRRFMIDIGKPNTVGNLRDMLLDPTRAYRSSVAWEGKSMEALQVDPQRVFAEADSVCIVFGMQLRLMYYFGARDEEAVQCRPLIADLGEWVLLSYGTKGGRSRVVKIRTPEQRAVLERCKELAKGNPRGFMGSSKLKPEAALRHFHYLLEKIELTKKGMGVTAYAMRHSFANNEYQAEAGVPSPVMGGPKLPADDRDRVEGAVASATGHNRRSANGPYNGSSYTMSKVQRWRCEALLDWFDTPEIRKELVDAGITSLKILGAEADGNPLGNTVLFGWEGAAQLSPEVREKVVAALATVLTGRSGAHRHAFLIPVSDPQARGLATLEVFS